MVQTPRLISSKDFADKLCMSRSSIYRLLEDDPTFPRPVKVGLKKIAFVEAESDAYLAARIALRQERAA